MSAQPAISDSKTVNSAALERAAGLGRWSIWNHEKIGNLTKGERRPGTRGKWWTPGQANKFLRRIGKAPVFGREN